MKPNNKTNTKVTFKRRYLSKEDKKKKDSSSRFDNSMKMNWLRNDKRS